MESHPRSIKAALPSPQKKVEGKQFHIKAHGFGMGCPNKLIKV